MVQKKEGNKKGQQAEEDETGKVDAYGNRIEENANGKNDDEDSEEKDVSDAAKVKENLRNSSRIYYNITHSVKEDITE